MARYLHPTVRLDIARHMNGENRHRFISLAKDTYELAPRLKAEDYRRAFIEGLSQLVEKNSVLMRNRSFSEIANIVISVVFKDGAIPAYIAKQVPDMDEPIHVKSIDALYEFPIGPVKGTVRFFINTDDEGEFWMSDELPMHTANDVNDIFSDTGKKVELEFNGIYEDVKKITMDTRWFLDQIFIDGSNSSDHIKTVTMYIKNMYNRVPVYVPSKVYKAIYKATGRKIQKRGNLKLNNKDDAQKYFAKSMLEYSDRYM